MTFSLPTNVTDLRSFFHLINQLSSNTATIAQSLQPLRPLLSVKNEFLWGTEHAEAFELAKKSLAHEPTPAFFDTPKSTRLMTNASCTGLGFVLQQKHDDTWLRVQAGSQFLSNLESHYATIEKEMLGVTWAIRKCHIFLAGLLHF